MEFNNLTIKEIKYAVKMYYSKLRNRTPFEIILNELRDINDCYDDDNCKLNKCEICKLIEIIKDMKIGWKNPNKNKKELPPCASAFFGKKYYKANGNTIILEFDDE